MDTVTAVQRNLSSATVVPDLTMARLPSSASTGLIEAIKLQVDTIVDRAFADINHKPFRLS